jgi:glycosyltransferase involved in cell wall biosynthesis
MSTNLVISIIVPVFNSENYIADTIISCLNQTYSNFELILVNDGSTDNVETVINKFADKRIQYFKIENSGACNARNFGISKANGHLIQFLDHDDILEFDKIEHQVKQYKKFGENFIYSATMGSVSGKLKTIDKGYSLYERDFTPQEYFETVLNQFGKYLTTGAWLVPAKLINSTYGWDSSAGLNDDGEYFMRIILNSSGIVFSKQSIFYFRRDVPNSLSKQFDNKQVYVKWFYSYCSYSDNFIKKFDATIAKELSWKALSIYYCKSYPHYPDLLEKCLNRIKDLGYTKPNANGGNLLIKIAKIIGVMNALKLWHLKSKVLNNK